MKKILVPTDFSDTSRDALRFAHEIARRKDCCLRVLHVSHPEFDPTNPYATVPLYSFLEEKKKRLKSFVDSTNLSNGSGKKIDVETAVVPGFSSEEIVRYAMENDIDMIVMGTTGEGGFLNAIVGSVSTTVMEKAERPVMLIPGGVRFNGFKNILYACNYESIDMDILRQVIDFAKRFDSIIHFVHVAEDADEAVEIETALFDRLFNEEAPTVPFNLVVIESESVLDGLKQYVEENKIDLVIFATKHRGLLGRLFHKSTSKEMVHHLSYPMMVLHYS